VNCQQKEQPNQTTETSMPETYGVTTTERLINIDDRNLRGGIVHVDIVDQRLNIGNGVADRREYTYQELWEAARKLNASDALLVALEKVTAELKQLHAHHYGTCEGGCPAETYIAEAEAAIKQAKGEA
jgi:hypothetical protein